MSIKTPRLIRDSCGVYYFRLNVYTGVVETDRPRRLRQSPAQCPSPPLHLLVVPRVKSAAGVWKLNSKAMFDRERLRELQTGYGEALAPLGIRRGESGSQAVQRHHCGGC